jgi:hypothetical protein
LTANLSRSVFQINQTKNKRWRVLSSNRDVLQSALVLLTHAARKRNGGKRHD